MNVNNPATTAEARRFITMVQAENSIFVAQNKRLISRNMDLSGEIDTLKRTLELACDYLADNNASRVDWQKHFMELAKEESENG